MSNNNRKKTIIIDALSNINDETLDKATEKRIGWINSMQKRKNKRRIAVMAPIAAVVVVLTLLTVILIPILGRKQVPVYTGMTVSGAVDESVALQNPEDHVVIRQDENGISITPLTKDPVFLAGNGNNGSNGNHYGNGNGNQAIPEGEAAEKAESLLNSAYSAQDIYYAKANEDIYITVHVDNPDSFEILSFTLNGNKYSSYMFERGSDLENLILKVNVGNAEGVIEYTLDNIKYVDGTEIKDVRLEGDRTVAVGVYTERQPSVSVSNVETGMYGVKAKVALNDPVGLLALSNCTPMAVVYDGENIVGSQELVLGNNDIEINMLTPESNYMLAIVARYDRYDGNGIDTYTLYESAIRTKGVLSLDLAEPTQTGISFSYSWNEGEGQIISSELFLDGKKVCDITGDKIDGLLSGFTYKIVTVFNHSNRENSVVTEFTTKAKNAPTYEITDPSATKTSVSFSITETDIDSIGEITEIKLSHANGTSFTKELADMVVFDGLLSNNDYTITVTYTYDLNDGNGVHTETVTKTVKTLAKTEPEYNITNASSTKTSASFGITETDIDSIGEITEIKLSHANGTSFTKELADMVVFDGLLSNNDYTITVTYTYDLNDGNGVHTETVTKTVKTLAKITPVVSVTDPTKTQTSVGFGIDVADTDNICTVTKIELWQGDILVAEAESLDVRSFDGLQEYTEYSVKISYTYDLNDGNGMQSSYVTKLIKTYARYITVEELQINNLDNGIFRIGRTLDLRVYVNNPDNCLIESFVINGKVCSATAYRPDLLGCTVYNVKYTTETVGKYKIAVTGIVYENGKYENSLSTQYQSEEYICVLDHFEITYFGTAENKTVFYEDETVIGVLEVKNAEIYDIKSICLENGDEYIEVSLTKISDTKYTFEIPYSESGNTMFKLLLSRVCYGIEDMVIWSNWWSADRYTVSYSVLSPQSEFIDISTPEQLQNMESGKNYRLTADLDMTGFDWQPYEFYGVLDGNGYVIKNLTINKPGIVQVAFDADNSIPYRSYGLFSLFRGVLNRVVIENAKIEIKENSNSEIVIACGFFSGMGFNTYREYTWAYTEEIYLLDCKVEGNVEVLCLAEGGGAFGGFVGAGATVYAKDCEYVGKISITSLMNFDAYSQFGAFKSEAYSCGSYADITVNGVTVAPQQHIYSGDFNTYNDCIFDSYENRPNK